jgi:hypothetical protein
MQLVRDEDDPNRCRARTKQGSQCFYRSEDGSDYCARHGGKVTPEQARQDYLTEQFTRRLKVDGKNFNEVELLRENVLRLQQMIATQMNLIKDQGSLAANMGAVVDLFMKAEKLTATLNRLSVSSGLLLAQPALIQFAQKVAQAVADMVEGKYDGWEDDLHELCDTIAKITMDSRNTESKK